MNRRVVLVSFADSNYVSSLERIKVETGNFAFTKRYFYTEKDFPKELKENLHYKKHRRGYGYWRWKSYLVKQVFNTLDENDIIVWSDAGNFWNVKGINRFREYLNLADSTDSGIVAFQQPFLEKDYAKGDLLRFLNAYDDMDIVMSLQLWGGCFIIRKTPVSIAFVNEWESIHLQHYDLITDKKSVAGNLIGFVEHRHDQSSFSVLVKKYTHATIPYNEVYDIYHKWDDMEFFPIQGKRLRHNDRASWQKAKGYLLLPYRYLLGLYLILFEKMYFRRKFWF